MRMLFIMIAFVLSLTGCGRKDMEHNEPPINVIVCEKGYLFIKERGMYLHPVPGAQGTATCT